MKSAKILCIISFMLMVLLYGCVTSTTMIEQLKKEIPQAQAFVEKHTENLALLVEIQDRLIDVRYTFNKTDKVYIQHYVDGRWQAQAKITSLHETTLLSRYEKNAILEILEDIDHKLAYIRIDSVLTEIIYMEYNRGRNASELVICNEDPLVLASYTGMYIEWIDDKWAAMIYYWQRG